MFAISSFDKALMVYYVKPEQISLGRRIGRTAFLVLATGVGHYFLAPQAREGPRRLAS